MNPTLLPHRIAETTEATALFACGYDPEWDEVLTSELDNDNGVGYLAALMADALQTLLKDETNHSYLRIVN